MSDSTPLPPPSSACSSAAADAARRALQTLQVRLACLGMSLGGLAALAGGAQGLAAGTVLVVLCAVVLAPVLGRLRVAVEGLQSEVGEHEQLALVAEHTQAMVVITDADGQTVWLNAAFERQTDWTLDELRGRRVSDAICLPATQVALRQALATTPVDGSGLRMEWQAQSRDGHGLWLDADLRPLRDPDGRLTGWILVATDVSERVLGQRKLQLLWSALPAGVMVQDTEGDVIDANPAAARLLGLQPGQLFDRHDRPPGWQILAEDGSPADAESQPSLHTLRSGQALHDAVIGVRQDGQETRWLILNTEPLHDTSMADASVASGVITCFADITATRNLQSELQRHARTDPLTRLPNRAAVGERIERALDHASRHPGYGFAVLFMDFDRFKQVNDTLGHTAGDELLRLIAQRLQNCLRPGDGLARVESALPLAARLGGDEFVVVLDGVRHLGVVSQIADRLVEDLAAPYLVHDTPIACTASIGIVLVADEAARAGGADAVLRNADTAMYEAKRAGRGRWVMFKPSMHERVLNALTIERELRVALERDELFVVYQPVVDLASGRATGAEALVRWRHPVRGLVSPAEFVPIAEECGLIEPLGAFVLEHAVAQWTHWQRTLGDAAPQMLVVNLSRAQVERPGLAARVQAVLQAHGLAPAQLQLEVTESMAASDERMQATLRELKALGVRLALDDFGTGYSSLACLHLLPVDTVKIDRSFVQHAETVEYHRVLIEATIRVARTLGMSTVAEGIETPGQAALMLDLRCTRGQGYLYGRPMEAAALEAWLSQRDAAAPREFAETA
ncbi:MAG: putative bifunctional diguanylate cyclase/phosphodiesterase [Rubrivivax sp.]|jgi:diguanylate cyclase (GGDEF)-like protein/PAS domain S-box-containing protein|nr:EAL domain-containing protein [Rubrivivax sp.]